MSKAKSKNCIVVFDDEQGLCAPMALDRDCEGALVSTGAWGDPVALFPNPAAARKAIRISTANTRLLTAQGKLANTDFTDAIKCIKVLPVVVAEG